MSKKFLFFSPDFRTLALAGAGFLTVTTAFSAFTMASKSKTFSSYFGSLNLNEQLQKFFPKAGSGISAAATSFTSLWSKALIYIPGFSKLTESLKPIWTKITSLTSGIIPGFQGIGSYLVQGWSYLRTAWKSVYSFLSTNMKWKYLLAIPYAMYLSILYFSDIAKTVWNYVKENLKDLSVFHWILTNLKKWLGTPIQQAKNLWESVKTIFYTFGYQWTKAAIDSKKGFDKLKAYITDWEKFEKTVRVLFKFFRTFETQLKNMGEEDRKEIAGMFLDDPENFLKKIEILTSGNGKWIVNGSTKMKDLLKKDITVLKVETTIKEVTETAKTITKDTISGITSIIKDIVGGSGGGGSGGEEGKKESSQGGVENVVDAASKAVQKTTSSFWTIISTIASGVADGVSKALTSTQQPQQAAEGK